MDKLYFYVLQTDAMLPEYLGDLGNHTNRFLSTATITSMASVQLAGDSDCDSEDNDNSDDEDDEVEDDNEEEVKMPWNNKPPSGGEDLECQDEFHEDR